jgi:hypothetical protein
MQESGGLDPLDKEVEDQFFRELFVGDGESIERGLGWIRSEQ